mmetsp:Transcript_26061/g.51118  ORF Transcript_26061/g.51118 Transcript_26061/m.51118 type:complete len:503 (-) Transcript_26061:117-1625(-)
MILKTAESVSLDQFRREILNKVLCEDTWLSKEVLRDLVRLIKEQGVVSKEQIAIWVSSRWVGRAAYRELFKVVEKAGDGTWKKVTNELGVTLLKPRVLPSWEAVVQARKELLEKFPELLPNAVGATPGSKVTSMKAFIQKLFDSETYSFNLPPPDADRVYTLFAQLVDDGQLLFRQVMSHLRNLLLLAVRFPTLGKELWESPFSLFVLGLIQEPESHYDIKKFFIDLLLEIAVMVVEPFEVHVIDPETDKKRVIKLRLSFGATWDLKFGRLILGLNGAQYKGNSCMLCGLVWDLFFSSLSMKGCREGTVALRVHPTESHPAVQARALKVTATVTQEMQKLNRDGMKRAGVTLGYETSEKAVVLKGKVESLVRRGESRRHAQREVIFLWALSQHTDHQDGYFATSLVPFIAHEVVGWEMVHGLANVVKSCLLKSLRQQLIRLGREGQIWKEIDSFFINECKALVKGWDGEDETVSGLLGSEALRILEKWEGLIQKATGIGSLL